MKICPNCGAQNKDNDRFCGECGAKLPDTPVEENAEKEPVSVEPAAPEEKKEEAPAVKTEEKSEEELNIMPLKGTIGEDESAEAKKEKEQAEAEKKKAEDAAKAAAAAPAEAKPEVEKKPEKQLTPEEIKAKKKAEKKEAQEKAKAQMKEEVRKLPRQYRPIGVWHYFLLELLYLVVPMVVSGLLLYYLGKDANNLVYDLILLSGPVLELIFLLIGAFASKNVNVRNFTKSYFLIMILLIILGLVLMLTKAGSSLQSWYSFKPLFH